jgi:hypothetical protein
MAQDMSTTLSWPAGREAIVVAVAKFEAVENEAMLRPPSRDSAKLPKLVPSSNLLAHVWNTLPSLHVPTGQIGIHPHLSLSSADARTKTTDVDDPY